MYNFTPRAHQVLKLARKEADRFSHNYVGTEHLLLGLVKLGHGCAVSALLKMGIDLETVRIEVEKQVAVSPETKVQENIPYTPGVNKVLKLADEEAKSLKHSYVGTEHILLGLLREDEGIAVQVLKNCGLEINQTRIEILKEPDLNITPANHKRECVTQPNTLSQQETEALNKHGVFFKKRILHELQGIQDVGILAEELGVSFGQTRVADIVAFDRREQTNLIFIFECKRAYTPEKRWIFFRDIHRRYRVCRCLSRLWRNSSVYASSELTDSPICSEGYEYKLKNGILNADQDPIFKAAAQLSAAYLGFIARRDHELERSSEQRIDLIERYIPVLITNSELFVIQSDLRATCLETGNMASGPQGMSVNFLLLKQPFPTPEGMEMDLRVLPGI